MFELDWPSPVLDQLADIWVAVSPDERDQIGTSIERLNRNLTSDPFEVGESREDPYRVTFVAGLTVLLAVQAYKVRVIHIRRPERRGR